MTASRSEHLPSAPLRASAMELTSMFAAPAVAGSARAASTDGHNAFPYRLPRPTRRKYFRRTKRSTSPATAHELREPAHALGDVVEAPLLQRARDLVALEHALSAAGAQ